MIVDAHLDLAYNVMRGRDVLKPAAEQRPDNEGVPTVGLPDLRRGNVNLVCATIFASPASRGEDGYRTPDEAFAAGQRQLQWYHEQHAAGELRIVHRRAELPTEASSGLHAIILLEGADPIRSPGEVPDWFDQGVRIVGLAWHGTRYAGGTGEPGPLTPSGVELVRAFDEVGIIHDASHLAEESFWQLLDLSDGPVMASHSNCRAIVPTDRQLSDEMIRAIIARGGVIGMNFFDKFLLGPAEYGKRRATLKDVVRHVDHICQLAGNANHVAIGTDMDGGLGREQIPQEIESSADLGKVADALRDAGYKSQDITNVLSGNWLRFFQAHLPEKMQDSQL